MEATVTKPSGIQRYIPILTWLPGYQSKWLRLDFIAGLTIMALLVPEGMAYAQLAGVPPQAAFYAAPAGLILYTIFGTSRHLVVAAAGSTSATSANIVAGLASGDLSRAGTSLRTCFPCFQGLSSFVGRNAPGDIK
jgi:MFS superfamily sulfate permease-like transporter